MEVGCSGTQGLELLTPNPGRKNILIACPTRNPATSPTRPAEGLRADPAWRERGSWPISHSPQGARPEAPHPSKRNSLQVPYLLR